MNKPTATVTCHDCGNVHAAEYSHEATYGTGAVYAVVCDDGLTAYYTEEAVRHVEAAAPATKNTRKYETRRVGNFWRIVIDGQLTQDVGAGPIRSRDKAREIIRRMRERDAAKELTKLRADAARTSAHYDDSNEAAAYHNPIEEAALDVREELTKLLADAARASAHYDQTDNDEAAAFHGERLRLLIAAVAALPAE